MPRRGLGRQLLGRVHGFDRMVRMVPHLDGLASQAGFVEIRTGEVPPWLRYIVAISPAPIQTHE